MRPRENLDYNIKRHALSNHAVQLIHFILPIIQVNHPMQYYASASSSTPLIHRSEY
jgi:hypothetical protein